MPYTPDDGSCCIIVCSNARMLLLENCLAFPCDQQQHPGIALIYKSFGTALNHTSCVMCRPSNSHCRYGTCIICLFRLPLICFSFVSSSIHCHWPDVPHDLTLLLSFGTVFSNLVVDSKLELHHRHNWMFFIIICCNWQSGMLTANITYKRS